MQAERPHAHAPRTTVQAVVAVLLALVVAAAAPLAGGSGERSMAAVLLVQGLRTPDATAASSRWSAAAARTPVAARDRAGAAPSTVLAVHRDLWRTALPPPAAV